MSIITNEDQENEVTTLSYRVIFTGRRLLGVCGIVRLSLSHVVLAFVTTSPVSFHYGDYHVDSLIRSARLLWRFVAWIGAVLPYGVQLRVVRFIG